jgi:hypothetical protein
MTTMDENELRKRVLERLTNSDDPNDIILEVCDQTDMDWDRAEKFTEAVRAEHESEITLYQSPVLVVIALGIFIGGAASLVYSTMGLVAAFETFRVVSPDLYALPQGIVFISYMISYAPQWIGGVILGLGMVVGSLKGMQKVWEAAFEKLGQCVMT